MTRSAVSSGVGPGRDLQDRAGAALGQADASRRPTAPGRCARAERRSAMHAAPVLVEEAGIDDLHRAVPAAQRVGRVELFAVPRLAALSSASAM